MKHREIYKIHSTTYKKLDSNNNFAFKIFFGILRDKVVIFSEKVGILRSQVGILRKKVNNLRQNLVLWGAISKKFVSLKEKVDILT